MATQSTIKDQILATVVESAALAVDNIMAGGPGSGRHSEVLYHGTTASKAAKIQREGLKLPRSGGQIIPHVTSNKEEAIKFAQAHGETNGVPVVIELKPEAAKFFDSGDIGEGFAKSSFRESNRLKIPAEYISKIHIIQAGGPGSGRHCEVCSINSKLSLCPKCDKAVETYTKRHGTSNADAIDDLREMYKRKGETVLRKYSDTFHGDLEKTLRQSLKAGEYTYNYNSKDKGIYPDDHKPAMRVPKGGSSCASCEYLVGKDNCRNEYFIKWNGSSKLPAPADEYCSDWFEPLVKIKAATEQSSSSLTEGGLWKGIKLTGFTGPDQEGLVAMLSRIPPDLLYNVKEITSAPELGIKHGRYLPETNGMLFNPVNFKFRQRYGQGEFWIQHPELTVIHEVGHSVFESFTPEEKQQWYKVCGWRKGWKLGQAPAYVEKRPGWEPGKSPWTHKAGVKFPRIYSEKNPNECFADCFAFFILGRRHQMGKEVGDFVDNLIKNKLKSYNQVSIESPEFPYPEQAAKKKAGITAYGTTEGLDKAWDKRGRGKNKKDSEKVRRAKETYVPIKASERLILEANERMVAGIVGGQHFGDNKPFDVMKGKYGIEVKTHFPDRKHEKVNMKGRAKELKDQAFKKMKLKGMYIVIVHEGKNKIYVHKLTKDERGAVRFDEKSLRSGNTYEVSKDQLKRMFK